MEVTQRITINNDPYYFRKGRPSHPSVLVTPTTINTNSIILTWIIKEEADPRGGPTQHYSYQHSANNIVSTV